MVAANVFILAKQLKNGGHGGRFGLCYSKMCLIKELPWVVAPPPERGV